MKQKFINLKWYFVQNEKNETNSNLYKISVDKQGIRDYTIACISNVKHSVKHCFAGVPEQMKHLGETPNNFHIQEIVMLLKLPPITRNLNVLEYSPFS